LYPLLYYLQLCKQGNIFLISQGKLSLGKKMFKMRQKSKSPKQPLRVFPTEEKGDATYFPTL